MQKQMTFTASGDALIARRMPENYPGFLEISRFLRRGAARMTNL